MSPPSVPFFPYKLFFLYIEPISALLGFYYAFFEQPLYLKLLSSPFQLSEYEIQAIIPTPTHTNIALTQLANLYLLFALNEHLVLSNSSSMTTWRTLLFGLLVADFGHLVSMLPLGVDAFAPWKMLEWNAMTWGSVGFVYMGASMRMAFLAGLGIKKEESGEGRVKAE